MKELLDVLPQIGRIEWIGLRPARKAPLESVETVQVNTELGLVGDHYQGKNGKRQVTLIQTEHLEGVASMLGLEKVAPTDVRRNIVVRGINLLALKDRRFRIGTELVLETTGLCHPCSRMEQNLGPGGYNAMRGHGGITARVISGGTMQLGDEVQLIPDTPSA